MIDRIIDELKKQNLELNERGMKELKENETALVCFAEKYEMSVHGDVSGRCSVQFSNDGSVVSTYTFYSAVR